LNVKKLRGRKRRLTPQRKVGGISQISKREGPNEKTGKEKKLAIDWLKNVKKAVGSQPTAQTARASKEKGGEKERHENRETGDRLRG